MRSSYLAVGYECNHKCICCPLETYDRLHKKMELFDIMKRIDRIPQAENNHIVLSGGEPMLHPDFYKILDYLSKNNFYITILSNSSRCKDSEFAKLLASYEQLDVVTAIHSSNPKIHDEITGISGSLLDTLEGLDNLVEVGVSITIKHIFNKITLPTIIETFDYLEKHFPPKVGFQFCTMDYSGRAKKNESVLFASRQDISFGLENVLDLLESRMSRKRRISVIETPYCFADPYYWKYFDGSIGPLSTYIAPNTDDKEMIFEVESECNTDYQECRKCALKSFCAGVWKSAYKLDNDLLKPVETYD